ncbi:hypothetical protein DNF23_18925 [Pseudomonas syringae pv. pisi]|jgi:hypothetical protein
MMINKTQLLGDLASISTILSFRDKSPIYREDGNALAMTVKDLTVTWPKPVSWLQRIDVEKNQVSQSLQNGDILMPARGNFYPARYFKVSDELVFPIGQIYVIRPHDEEIARFLSWYLNRSQIQAKLSREVSGTTVMSLRKTSLSSLEIEIPPQEVLTKISTITRLIEEHALVRIQLDSARKLESDTACELLLKGPDCNEK